MRIPVVVAFVAGVASPARADDTLTLPQVLAAAVRQSPDLERASIDVKVAEAALLRAGGIEDAHLGATVDIQKSRNNEALASENKKASAAVTLSKVLPTGGTLGVRFEGEFINAITHVVPLDMDPYDAVSKAYTTTATVSLTQPLLRGGWPTGFEAPIRDAAHTRDAATLGREAKARTLVVQIAEAYWQVSLARESLAVRKNSLELANQQLAFTQAQIRSEKVAKSEELAVKQVIATRQQDVITAEQQIYDRSLALRELAGLEIGPTALAVTTEALGNIGDDKLEITTTVAAAFEHSAELASLGESLKAAQANVEGANSTARPRLDITLGGGPAGVDESLAKSASKAARGVGYELSANLTFDTAIERRVEKGTVADAHARLQRAKVDERAARARTAAQAIRIVQRVKAAYASVKLSDEAIDLAHQNIDFENKRFLAGKSTNFDVLRRQDELEQANLRRVSAIVDYLGARAELDALTGAIFSRFGITVR